MGLRRYLKASYAKGFRDGDCAQPVLPSGVADHALVFKREPYGDWAYRAGWVDGAVQHSRRYLDHGGDSA